LRGCERYRGSFDKLRTGSSTAFGATYAPNFAQDDGQKLAKARAEICGRKGWRVEGVRAVSGFLRQAQDRLFDCVWRKCAKLRSG